MRDQEHGNAAEKQTGEADEKRQRPRYHERQTRRCSRAGEGFDTFSAIAICVRVLKKKRDVFSLCVLFRCKNCPAGCRYAAGISSYFMLIARTVTVEGPVQITGIRVLVGTIACGLCLLIQLCFSLWEGVDPPRSAVQAAGCLCCAFDMSRADVCGTTAKHRARHRAPSSTCTHDVRCLVVFPLCNVKSV